MRIPSKEKEGQDCSGRLKKALMPAVVRGSLMSMSVDIKSERGNQYEVSVELPQISGH